MPADLVTAEVIPSLAKKIDSAGLLRALRRIQLAGFIMNGSDVDNETRGHLEQLAQWGLVDPAYSGGELGTPFVWVSNGNGKRVLNYFETNSGSRIRLSDRARTALGTLDQEDREAVLASVEFLQAHDPSLWPAEQVTTLNPEEGVYLLRVPPDWCVFYRVPDSGNIELFDIMTGETLRLMEGEQLSGSQAG